MEEHIAIEQSVILAHENAPCVVISIALPMNVSFHVIHVVNTSAGNAWGNVTDVIINMNVPNVDIHVVDVARLYVRNVANYVHNVKKYFAGTI
jgi:hypothetical protein